MQASRVHRLDGPERFGTDQGPDFWTAQCACGWRIGPMESRESARGAYEEHLFDLRRAIRREGTASPGSDPRLVHRLVALLDRSAEVYLTVDAPATLVHGAERYYAINSISAHGVAFEARWIDGFRVQEGIDPAPALAQRQEIADDLDALAEGAVEDAGALASRDRPAFVELEPTPLGSPR